MSKRQASLFSIAMALAILAPLHEKLRGDQGDSFPFSWYPMFSRRRPDPERANYVVAEADDGTRIVLDSRYYARGSMNQARHQLQTLASDPKSAEQLCRTIAERLAKKKNGDLSRVERVRIVRGWFDMEEYFGKGNKTPLREQAYAACPVPGRASIEEPAP